MSRRQGLDSTAWYFLLPTLLFLTVCCIAISIRNLPSILHIRPFLGTTMWIGLENFASCLMEETGILEVRYQYIILHRWYCSYTHGDSVGLSDLGNRSMKGVALLEHRFTCHQSCLQWPYPLSGCGCTIQ